jgi:glutamine amidotransferase-like uncharacterized protein
MRERFRACGYPVQFIDHQEIAETTGWMHETQLLVFGGQSVTAFKQALGSADLTRIDAFVHQGGKYLGICAGGYFGASLIRFTGAYESKRSDGLKFFNGLAEGSRPEIVPPYTGHTDTAAVIRLMTNDHRALHSLYWGGPSFLPFIRPDRQARPLAYFTDETGAHHLMGLQTPVGANGGSATLLGYHPEISYANIRRWIVGNEGTAIQNRALFKAVQETDPALLDFGFEHLLSKLNLNDGASQVKASRISPAVSIPAV